MAIKTMYCCDVCGRIVDKREQLTQISAEVKWKFTESLDEKFRKEIKKRAFVTVEHAHEFVVNSGYGKYLDTILSIQLNDDDVFQVMVTPKRNHKKLKTIDLCDACCMERLPEIFWKGEDDDTGRENS